MAQYPTTPKPQIPYLLEPVWNTKISTFDAGNEQRKQKATYAKYDVTFTYNGLTQANINLLYTFYMARKGAYEPFHVYTLESEEWTELWVGQGDSILTTFDIPGQSTSSQSIYIDGVLQTEATHYTILTGGGDSDSDRVEFVTAPPLGSTITCDITGYMRIRGRFDQDKMSRDYFVNCLYRTGIKIKGLNPAEL